MSTRIYNAFEFTGALQTLAKELQCVRTKRLLKVSKDLKFGWSDLIYARNHVPLKRKLEEVACVFIHGKRVFVWFSIGSSGREGPERYFKSKNLWKDFHYQNSSDKPEDITDKEWKARRRIWEKILPDTLTPAAAGFTYELVSLVLLSDYVYSKNPKKEKTPEGDKYHARYKKNPIEAAELLPY
jgi:hypothetical protein